MTTLITAFAAAVFTFFGAVFALTGVLKSKDLSGGEILIAWIISACFFLIAWAFAWLGGI